MKNNKFVHLIIAVFLFCECKGTPQKKEMVKQSAPYRIEEVSGVFWTTETLPNVWKVPTGVGFVEKNNILNAKQAEELEKLFRFSYFDALLNNMPLLSVLGTDKVHVWPKDKPVTWVQNWETEEPYNNSSGSWDMPNLVLAALSPEERDVWMVSGAFLDHYGKSLGLSGLNGAAGYGTPVSDVFYIKNTLTGILCHAQRFEKGLFVLDQSGTVTFTKEAAALKEIDISNIVGLYEDGGDQSDTEQLTRLSGASKNQIKNKFQKAYKDFIRKTNIKLVPDDNVQFVDLQSQDWNLFANTKIKYCYVQFYNSESYAAVYPVIADGEGDFTQYALKCRIIQKRFLDVLIKNIRVSGAENLAANKCANKSNTKLDALIRAMALYGVPVTDTKLAETGVELIQRFSKGYMHESMVASEY
ncbi:MAG: hypothetical protein Ta2B_06770 [Termitinemataceae bacterium]|nr:MAG: hypothetical protein Ta2B_06770 [Termitinemataceae bacterium]